MNRDVETIVYNAYQMYTGSPREGAEDPFAMHSYNRPANLFWSGFVEELLSKGLSQEQTKTLLCSKERRYMFDQFEEKLIEFAGTFVDELLVERAREL